MTASFGFMGSRGVYMIKGIKYAKYYMDNENRGLIIGINEGFTEITGYTMDDVETRKITIYDLVPENHRKEYMQIVYQAMENGEAYLNHEIKCKDGRTISVHCYGEVYRDEETGHLCSKVIIVDVTEQEVAVTKLKEKEEQLELQIEKIKLLSVDAQEFFIDYDIQRDYFEVSRFYQGNYEIFYVKENYFNSSERTIHPEDFMMLCEAFLVSKGGSSRRQLDLRSKLFTGQYCWYRLVYTKYVNPKTGRSHIIGRGTDINDEKKARLILEKGADTDQLTGVYNRTATERKINEILQNDDLPNGHTMILMDLDYFKNVNDVLGYSEGDAILGKIGGILSQMFRQDFDILGRVDGDVFVAFVRNTSDIFYIESQCKELCERLREECTPRNSDINISVSIGIALTDSKCDTFKKLYKKADKALQRQIDKGRNGYSF